MRAKTTIILSGFAMLILTVVIIIQGDFKSENVCPDTKILIDVFERGTSLDDIRNEQVTKALKWLKSNDRTGPVLLDASVIESLSDDFEYTIKVYFLDRSGSVYAINFRSNDHAIEIEGVVDPYLIESTYHYGYIDHKYLRPILSTESGLEHIKDKYWKDNCLLLTPDLFEIILEGDGDIVLYDSKRNVLGKIDLDVRVRNGG